MAGGSQWTGVDSMAKVACSRTLNKLLTSFSRGMSLPITISPIEVDKEVFHWLGYGRQHERAPQQDIRPQLVTTL